LESRLGPLLFQLPPYFKRTEEHAARLEHFLAMLPLGLRCTFEFRDRSWFGEDTLQQLRRYGVAFCSYDKPDVKCPLAATARFAYLRFHGPSARYRGKYTDEMLEAWAERLRKLAEYVDEVCCCFNNDARANAIANAKTLARLVDAAPATACAANAGLN